jgi:PTH1 family peptidyl-tRNA hydrolase
MTEKEWWLIVGLGNPGRRYAQNRHNVGFQCVDRLGHLHNLAFDKRQNSGRLAVGQIGEQSVLLFKPQTFMNESGSAVGSVARFYQVSMERLLVIYDDLDLPLGSVRLRQAGGSGGHKGMNSIISHLGGLDFPRVRVGIGRPPGRMDPAAYVLQDFARDEHTLIEEVYDHVARAAECWLTDGIELAMARFNRVMSEE